jgi:septal ring factor EnvC (AmiA/AmiB activator)
MASKLDRIEQEIAKTRTKILEQQSRLKELEARKAEEENAQIVQMVKSVNIDAAQLAAFLAAYASGEMPLPQQPQAGYIE